MIVNGYKIKQYCDLYSENLPSKIIFIYDVVGEYHGYKSSQIAEYREYIKPYAGVK